VIDKLRFDASVQGAAYGFSGDPGQSARRPVLRVPAAGGRFTDSALSCHSGAPRRVPVVEDADALFAYGLFTCT